MDFVWEKIQIENGHPSEKILIIARNLRYAKAWCDVYNINYNSHMISFASHLNDLRGISGMHYVDLGTDDEDFRTLIERLKAMNAIKPLLTPNA